jgi:hypothetical protein
VQSFTQ